MLDWIEGLGRSMADLGRAIGGMSLSGRPDHGRAGSRTPVFHTATVTAWTSTGQSDAAKAPATHRPEPASTTTEKSATPSSAPDEATEAGGTQDGAPNGSATAQTCAESEEADEADDVHHEGEEHSETTSPHSLCGWLLLLLTKSGDEMTRLHYETYDDARDSFDRINEAMKQGKTLFTLTSDTQCLSLDCDIIGMAKLARFTSSD